MQMPPSPFVSTDKNGLGGICMVIGLVSVWHIIQNPRRSFSHVAVLLMVAWLFGKADSSTALACFHLGSALIVMTRRLVGRAPGQVHVVIAGVAGACLLLALLPSGFSYFAGALGRNTTLTGRTDIWKDLLQMDVNPWIGRGFESFWLGDRADYFAQKYYFHPNQAHNGYIETYVNLGLIGVGFIAALIATGYRRIVDAFRADALSSLRLGIFVAAVIYNVTEATFKVMHPIWIVLLLTIAMPALEEREEQPATREEVTAHGYPIDHRREERRNREVRQLDRPQHAVTG
jgi:O-antigen ligase